ncbi:uncharacterized protein PODANS_6_40 [Podospora anserina S mat+]|uniref:Podospora anserina S mat+ genomic DNA chromosome 6, supercontig 2 n=1 Tax=Podospora anserina (strain S / ATCC MYA-4624 / DSM 980 / FGSC 10383) TaxID=515849 RepID=B2B3G9_PODAN|nr:uncharacterized protein PODANS_6_40 [Podospora anserina S mat+]CAP71655.1 unnamed protein product [Podospora anserina S mat+]CDP31048.1 Putative protein of unknown function [Podospora anserina S mat+]
MSATEASPPFVEPYPGYAAENKGPTILGVTSAMTLLGIVFVAARVYSRVISMGKIYLDDYITLFSITLCVIYVGLAGAAISHGGGRHLDTLSPEDVKKALYYTVISFVPGVSSFTIPKFAVVVLLRKILNPGRAHRMVMWVVSVIYGLLAIGMLVINFAQCTPARAQWLDAPGKCWDRQITVDYAMALGIYSVLFDFYLAIYPTVVLFQLQLNWRKKLALSSSLGFGYCAGVITCYKCYTLSGLLEVVDFTYTVDDVVLWTNIEANCVIIGACIPCLYPLIRKLFGNSALGGTSGPTGGNSKSGGGYRGNTGRTNTVVTIGSYAKNKGRSRSKSISQLDTINDMDADSKYIILEERSFHCSTAELTEPDAVAANVQNEHRKPERVAKPDGW